MSVRLKILLLLPLLLPTTAVVRAAETDVALPELGRLFYSPERRTQLERQRLQKVKQVHALEGATLSLDGVVNRSSGKSTVWLNQRPQHEYESEQTGVQVRPDARVPGKARLSPENETPIDLRVGETINRGTGERNDRLGGGSVISPAKR
jgi:hypothetical protein